MRFTKVLINGITIKDDNGLPDPRKLIEWEYEKEDDVAVSEAELILPRSVESLVQLTNGQVVEIWTGWTTSTDRRTFYGFIEDIQPEGAKIKVIAKNEMIKLVRKNVNHIYDSNIDASAGVISEIAKDLIEVYGEITADVENSGTAEGRTIDQFKCVNTDVYERVVALKKALDWQLNYSDAERKVKFQPRGFIDSGKTLTVGQEIIKLPKWNFDTSQIINDLRVDGAFTQTDITETGQIGVTENFEELGITLAKTPDIVELIMDSGNPPTTQREGGTKDASVGHFYYVDRENKKVKPAEGTTFPLNNYAIVNYVWSAPAPIHLVNSESIEEFGRFEKQMTISDITSIADAETRASSILNRRSLPFVMGDLLVKNQEASIPELGQIITIVDNVSPKTPSGQYIVTKITYRYPSASIEIQVGDKPWRMADWQEDTEGRIKALEDQFVRNQDLILELINIANTPVNNLKVPIPRWRAVYSRDLTESTTLVWGNPTSGIWGEFRWGNIAGAGFILGNSQYGILGTSPLGFGSSEELLYFMQQYGNEYAEEFIDEDFHDSENSTASWGVGSVSFNVGEVVQSLPVDKNNGTINQITATFTSSGTFTYEASADGGQNWETITSGVAHVFANPGTELLWRVTESGASTGTLTKVVIIGYH